MKALWKRVHDAQVRTIIAHPDEDLPRYFVHGLRKTGTMFGLNVYRCPRVFTEKQRSQNGPWCVGSLVMPKLKAPQVEGVAVCLKCGFRFVVDYRTDEMAEIL